MYQIKIDFEIEKGGNELNITRGQIWYFKSKLVYDMIIYLYTILIKCSYGKLFCTKIDFSLKSFCYMLKKMQHKQM